MRCLVPLVALVVLLAASAHARTASRLAEVELGFRGAPVADAWNPVRVTVRDLGSGQLVLSLDQGSLRAGAIPWSVVLPIAGGAGVRVLEADVYLPNWRSLSWTVEAGGTVVASGALPRDAADRRPLDLVVSARPGTVAERLGGRVVDVAASDLPTRAAAYDGVRSVWVDGSAGVPRPAALTAAAAAGALVVLDEGLRAGELADLLPAGEGWLAVGAGGWWIGPPPGAATLETLRVDQRAWAAAFAAAGGVTVPSGPPPGQVVVIATVYALLVMVAWRVAGVSGLATWLVLLVGAATLAGSGWQAPDATLVERRALQVGAGGLAVRHQAHDVLTLPAAEVSLPLVARPASAIAGGQRLGPVPSTSLALSRWRGATLLERPSATGALLGIDANGLPVALGDVVLTEVRIVGGAAWEALYPDRPLGEPRDPLPLRGAAAEFEALLPVGAAWARAGQDWHVALPAGREARP